MDQLNIALVVHDLHNHGGHSAYAKILAGAFSRRSQHHCSPAIPVRSNHLTRRFGGSASKGVIRGTLVP